MSTQSTHNFKPLYEFTIEVQREVGKQDEHEENGVTTIVKTKVKEPAPVFVCFKKPSRAEREDADTYRAVQWQEYVKKGVLPEALLLKTYSNSGGILDDLQKAEYNGLRAKLLHTMEDYQRARVAKEPIADLTEQILILRDKIIQFEREQNVFFENTAEAKARNKLTEYLVLHQSYKRDSVEKPWEPMFSGLTTEDRAVSLENAEENADEIYIKARERLWFISALYIQLGGDISKDDIAAFEKQPDEKPNGSSSETVTPAAS